jgi:hypothetical protein
LVRFDECESAGTEIRDERGGVVEETEDVADEFDVG